MKAHMPSQWNQQRFEQATLLFLLAMSIGGLLSMYSGNGACAVTGAPVASETGEPGITPSPVTSWIYSTIASGGCTVPASSNFLPR